MSVEFANAIANDGADERIEAEIAANANGRPIAIPETGEIIDAQPVAAIAPGDVQVSDDDMDPGF